MLARVNSCAVIGLDGEKKVFRLMGYGEIYENWS